MKNTEIKAKFERLALIEKEARAIRRWLSLNDPSFNERTYNIENLKSTLPIDATLNMPSNVLREKSREWRRLVSDLRARQGTVEREKAEHCLAELGLTYIDKGLKNRVFIAF